MIHHVLSRILQSIIVLAVMSVAVHALMGLMPGDPLDLMIMGDPHLTPDDVVRLKALYGVDKPWFDRYLAWAGQAVQGQFGYSRLFAKPVWDALIPALGNSLILAASALTLSLILAVPLGILAAARPHGWIDRLINGVAFLSISLPTFWLGLMLILAFAVHLNWLPASGMSSLDGAGGWGDRLRHMILPVCTLSLAGLGQYIRHMRAAILNEARHDYVRTARAKGCGTARVMLRHQLRNAMIPVTTLVALDLGQLLSGALITETVFAWPGMGRLMSEAILGNDFNLALVGLLLATFATLVGSVLADVAYAVLDRRVSFS